MIIKACAPVPPPTTIDYYRLSTIIHFEPVQILHDSLTMCIMTVDDSL